jgi:hypothetical protein
LKKESFFNGLYFIVFLQVFLAGHPEETLMAKLVPGKYTLMVVDDQGRFAERQMNVKMVQ